MALARCAACSVQTFADEHWGRSPLLSRAVALGGGYDDLLTPAAVDELVSARGVRTPFLRMAKDGAVKAASTYTRGGGAGAAVTDQAADDKILRAIGDGSTLVLQGLHRTWPPLVAFGAQLAADLGHPVQINAYITPPENQGFAPHHDVHDVFVLQIAGRKHWTVHEPVLLDPLDSQPFDGVKDEIAARVSEPPLIDTVLEPGDALYLPRGTVHSAEALGETSIHLTVGIHSITRYQLVRFLLDEVQSDPELRASLPMGVDLSDPEVLAPHLQATVAALREAIGEVPVAEVADRLSTNLMQRTRPEPIGPLAQLAAADTLTADLPVIRRGALRFRLEPAGEERANVVLLDRTVEIPVAVASFISGGQSFTPAELVDLEPEDRLATVRRLLREGVLVPA